MTISKRDFRLLSEMLCHASPMFKAGLSPTARSARMKQWREDVAAVAAVLQHHNDRFDIHTFYQACGVPPEEKVHD